MTIDQHAEAAAEKIVERYEEPQFYFVYEIIAKHMQAAIDEATAPLRERIAALEGLGPLIEEYADSGIVMANAIHTKSPERQKRASERRREALAKINAILKGGAS